jgi:hypothetical protein
MVLETLAFYSLNHLTQVDREDFIIQCRRESYKSYIFSLVCGLCSGNVLWNNYCRRSYVHTDLM